jgi:6-phosphogluconate dehydrogenase (decarboxylating)
MQLAMIGLGRMGASGAGSLADLAPPEGRQDPAV